MRKQRGFTLIEIMTVVTIVAILSSVALPSYSEHVRRGQRVAARAVLLEAASWMERRFSVHHNYLGNDHQIPILPDGLNRSPRSGAEKYVISLTTGKAQATAYQLRAVPSVPDKCGSFTLDHTGARGLIGNTASLKECWGS
ncbi:type IV pilin protein [Collimonas silvisoli]|uniref:type IV pilin protein n=1 Tax=Collimonas silvisoli TaxID=2825884 RepID=UPI001B8BDBFB|nr:type IV pilin protein [Collimonas silvisoli]